MRLWWRVQASAVTGSNRLPKLCPADRTAFFALRAGGERASSAVRCTVCRQRPDQRRRGKAQANGQPLQRMFHHGAVTGHRRDDDAQSALRQSRGLSDGSRESAVQRVSHDPQRRHGPPDRRPGSGDGAKSVFLASGGSRIPPAARTAYRGYQFGDRGHPPERIRLHVCWGNSDGPHVHDIAMTAILPELYRANVGALSIEFANPRHQHEYDALRSNPLPAHMLLMPGVLDSTTNFVEHPELVARRLEEAVSVVGHRERVIAGTDCGFGTFAGREYVAEEVVWVKLAAAAEGARIASHRLWGRAVG